MARILIVDDEVFNLDILQDYIEFAGHEVVRAINGKEAEDILREDKNFSVIVLDRMMPVMDGLTLTKIIRQDDTIKDIPIIMQTAMSTPEQITEGISAGVFYYLTKPYVEETLIAVLNSALEQFEFKSHVSDQVTIQKRFVNLMQNSFFKFHSVEDAKSLSFFLSSCFAEPERALLGLTELTVNAVEHGNLGITYYEKKTFLEQGILQQEIANRLAKHSDKFATLTFQNKENEIEIIIEDMGQGFDFKKYLVMDPNRMTDPNGRGIAMSNMMSFDEIEYQGSGNKVKCIMKKVS